MEYCHGNLSNICFCMVNGDEPIKTRNLLAYFCFPAQLMMELKCRYLGTKITQEVIGKASYLQRGTWKMPVFSNKYSLQNVSQVLFLLAENLSLNLLDWESYTNGKAQKILSLRSSVSMYKCSNFTNCVISGFGHKW